MQGPLPPAPPEAEGKAADGGGAGDADDGDSGSVERATAKLAGLLEAIAGAMLHDAASAVGGPDNALALFAEVRGALVGMPAASRDAVTRGVADLVRSRYAGGDARIAGSRRRLHVVWDLDDCLIKSARIGGKDHVETDPALFTTVVEREGGVAGHRIVQVDDDMMRFDVRLSRAPWLPLTLGSPLPPTTNRAPRLARSRPQPASPVRSPPTGTRRRRPALRPGPPRARRRG